MKYVRAVYTVIFISVKAEQKEPFLFSRKRTAFEVGVAAGPVEEPGAGTKKSSLRAQRMAGVAGVGSLALPGTGGKGGSCLVCLEEATEPLAAACGHICCAGCWERIFAMVNGSNCPSCRKVVTRAGMVKIRLR